MYRPQISSDLLEFFTFNLKWNHDYFLTEITDHHLIRHLPVQFSKILYTCYLMSQQPFADLKPTIVMIKYTFFQNV